MAIYAVFGVGVGNLGHGRAPRRPMAKWVEMLNGHLSQGYPLARIVCSFCHTGNFLVDSVSTDHHEVTAGFKHLLETDWVVRPIDDVRGGLTAITDISKPEDEDGIRWTLGARLSWGDRYHLWDSCDNGPSRPLEDFSLYHRSLETRQPRRRRNAGPESEGRWLGWNIRRH